MCPLTPVMFCLSNRSCTGGYRIEALKRGRSKRKKMMDSNLTYDSFEHKASRGTGLVGDIVWGYMQVFLNSRFNSWHMDPKHEMLPWRPLMVPSTYPQALSSSQPSGSNV